MARELKGKFKTVSVRVHTRSIDRAVARHNLEKKGALHNAIKSGHFANNWRVYANAKEVIR